MSTEMLVSKMDLTYVGERPVVGTFYLLSTKILFYSLLDGGYESTISDSQSLFSGKNTLINIDLDQISSLNIYPILGQSGLCVEIVQ